MCAHGRALHSFSSVMMKEVGEVSQETNQNKTLQYTRAAVFLRERRQSVPVWGSQSVSASKERLQSKRRKISASENGACFELARNISVTGCGECNFKVLKSTEFWKQLLKFVSKSDLTSPVSDVYKWHTPLNHICTQCMNSHILDFPFQIQHFFQCKKK